METNKKLFFGIEVVVLSVIFLIGWFLIDIMTSPTAPQVFHDDTSESMHTPYQSELGDEYTQAQKDLDELTRSLLQLPASQDHNAAQGANLDTLCRFFGSICTKTQREGTYSTEDRLNYQGLLIYLIKQLDRRLETRSSLESTIESIRLSSFQPDKRGSAGHTHVRFNTSKINSRNEFFQVSVHEMMHIVDLGVVEGRSVFKDTAFTEFGKTTRASNDPSIDFYKISRTDENTRIQQQGPEHFVSGYALKNIYEDLAETGAMFLLYHDLFVKKAKTNSILREKYEYFDKLFGGKYLQSGNEYINAYDTSKNYWDVTRLFEDLS